VHGAVYDVAGRRVARLSVGSEGRGTGGSHLVWNGRDPSGAPAARGVYLIRAESGGMSASAKVVYLGD
jgi:hypothetical protein